MWPYTSEENDWLSNGARASRTPRRQEVSWHTVQYYIARGRHMRAGCLRRLGRRLAAVVRRWVAPSRTPAGFEGSAVQLIHDLRTPLTSIRSYSEILRNHPELPQGQRANFLEIILSESRRLERAIRSYEAQFDHVR